MRGLLLAFEGIDRTGKTTQAAELVKSLTDKGIDTTLIRFPKRDTTVG